MQGCFDCLGKLCDISETIFNLCVYVNSANKFNSNCKDILCLNKLHDAEGGYLD